MMTLRSIWKRKIETRPMREVKARPSVLIATGSELDEWGAVFDVSRRLAVGVSLFRDDLMYRVKLLEVMDDQLGEMLRVRTPIANDDGLKAHQTLMTIAYALGTNRLPGETLNVLHRRLRAIITRADSDRG